MRHQENKPRVKVIKTQLDKKLEIAPLVSLGLLIIVPLYFYNQLPEEIPMRFDLKGIPNNYDSKTSIFIIPVIGTAMFFLFKELVKHPHSFNYPFKITKENAQKQYSNATRLIRWTNLIITTLFAFLTSSIILSALDIITSLSMWIISPFIIALISTIGYYTVQSFKLK